MKIENLSTEKKGGRTKVSATIVWEDIERPTHDVYFETEDRFSDSLTCDPHAFLVGCAIPAMHYGEKRVFISEKICPELIEGLEVAMSWLRAWYYKPGDGFLKIETSGLRLPSRERIPERAGFFFSGGIDSFATLKSNRMHYPPEHPRFIREGILVYGLEQDDPKLFPYVLESLSKTADALDLALIPVYTNVYQNYRQDDAAQKYALWGDEFGGAALAAVAHAFSRRFTNVSIAATYCTQSIEPWGSHPLLEPNYSSHGLRILHGGIELSRLEKVRLIADWDVALQNIRVCNQYRDYQAGMLNCCNCEKCLRTMMELMASGVLERSDAFPRKEVSEKDLIRKTKIKGEYTKLCYSELMAPLSSMGRHDLVRIIRKKISAYQNKNWIRRIKQSIVSP